MKKIVNLFLIFFFLSFGIQNLFAGNISKTARGAMLTAPIPTTCVTPVFTKTGDFNWFNISLKLTNNCGRDIDLQNSTVTFLSGDNLNTNFWGQFGPISYPDNPLLISSQPTGTGNYIASFSLHIPEESWANSVLHNGQFITIQYGAPFASYDQASVKVYLSGTPVPAGTINLVNRSTRPATISQSFAIINVISNGQIVNKAQVPWAGQILVPNLPVGTYTIQPENLLDSEGNTFRGTAVPASVAVLSNQTVSSAINYTKVVVPGSIIVATPLLPSALAGYTGQPTVMLTRPDTGATLTKTLTWNLINNVSGLGENVLYNLSTPVITFNNNRCTGSFNPASMTSRSVQPQTTVLSYNCVPLSQVPIRINVSGLPSSVNTINVAFRPVDGSTAISKNVAIVGGTGTDTVNLTTGAIYGVSSTSVPGFTSLYQPQPLTARAGTVLSVTYQMQTSNGKIIGFIPGWVTPPTPASLAAAGYTHAMAAFGVFSTSQPGVVVNAFTSITRDYITALHQAGIKVLLSLGGALTSIPNTSVDFHQVLTLASSPTAFQQTFVNSLESLITQYGFDGIDIDIEHGLIPSGTFANPTGDIAVLANILNTLHSHNPNLLITLTPQVANISPTPSFTETWGNYASLIMQTHDALSWVGIQVYNTGCALGLDQVCYADSPNSPNLSVAMAAGLLENWPAVDSLGRPTGFQPYVSFLTPDQVVLGYPAPNRNGESDGSPVKPTSVIKRAIQCLRTGVVSATSCDTYRPPRRYAGINGVFEWQVLFDQDNNFRFATDLRACIFNGICN